MPFVSRVTTTPPLASIQQLEQVIIVDSTGPAIPLGVAPGAVCLVGEFTKGPFTPTEVFSSGDITNIFGSFYRYFSQTVANGDQTGAGLFWNGNGIAELKGKTLRRLVLQRTDMDVFNTGRTGKCFVRFTLTVDSTEQDSTKTALDIVIPAGTRFADDATTPTVIIALSQDIRIPKGTVHSAGSLVISAAVAGGPLDLVQDAATGQLSMPINASGVKTGGTFGATAFYVKGIAATGGTAIDSVLDTAIPGYASVISTSGVSIVDAAGSGTTPVPPGAGTEPSLQDFCETQTIAAIGKTVPGTVSATNDIIAIWAARNDKAGAFPPTSFIIRTALSNNAINSSQVGRGRIACVSANQAIDASSTSFTSAKTAINALQTNFTTVDADRVSINAPYAKVYASELAQNITVSPAGFKAMLFGQLPEEYESGVANSYLSQILSFEDCFAANALTKADYISFRSKGASVLQNDRSVGWWFVSSVTAASGTNYPTRVKDNRRRFADFVQDTLAGVVAKYNKMPATTERLDAIAGEFDAFLSSLVSAANPSQQRMDSYQIDMKSGNTPTLTGLGIWTFIIRCRMLGDLDDIILQTEIGPTVTITQVA